MSAVTAEGQLFEADSMVSEPPPSPRKVRVDKTFRRYDPDQSLLMPPSLRDWLPEDHLAHFVSELVDEVLDLSPFLASYTEASLASLAYEATTSDRLTTPRPIEDLGNAPGVVVSNEEEQLAEVQRLLELGAARVDWDYPKDADFVVLADPDGNLLCVINTSA